MKKVTTKQIMNIRKTEEVGLLAANRIAVERNLKHAINELDIDKDLREVLLALANRK